MSLLIDFSHVHRPITGIERVSLDLFSPEALPALDPVYVRAKSNLGMVFAQWIEMPLRALFSSRLVVCPGFPPSLLLGLVAGKRVLPYIHDLFLIERKQELNRTAKYYMRPSFARAVRKGKAFLVNSLCTKNELLKYCPTDAEILVCRPPVKNIFGLSAPPVAHTKETDKPLRIVSVGTIEPRKNFLYGADICDALAKRIGRNVEFHIIGRAGWSDDMTHLAERQNVILHGYLSLEEAKTIIDDSDLFLSTSHEEGLGLPLLEVQHGGKLVVASDIPSYREVLGTSGLLIPLGQTETAATMIEELLSAKNWEDKQREAALRNVAGWNTSAANDRTELLSWLRRQTTNKAST